MPVGGVNDHAAIFLYENLNPYPLTIRDNQVYAYNSRFGMVLQMNDGGSVYENEVMLDPDPSVSFAGEMHGVALFASQNMDLHCNTISGNRTDYVPDFNQQGIWGFLADQNRYTCNTFENTTRGIWFIGGNLGSQFNANTFGNHYTGLNLSFNALVGQQDYKGNRWTGSYGSTFGAVHGSFDAMGTVPPGWVSTNSFASPFIVNNNSNVFFPSRIPMNWFTQNSITNDQTCSDFNINCNEGNTGGGGSGSGSSGIESLIAGGGYTPEVYPETEKWEAAKYLYEKIVLDSTGIYNDSTFQIFQDSVETTGIPEFQSVKEEQKQIMESHPLLGIYQGQIQGYLKRLNITDSLLLINPNAIDSLERAIIYDSLQWVLHLSDSLSTALENVKQSQSGSLLSQNSQITVNAIWEENLKTVNEIYLSTVVRGIYTFTQSQSEDLYEIAIQCPLEGGKAVFLARGLYEQYNHLSLNDIAVCFNAGYNLRQGNTQPIEESIRTIDIKDYTVYPNPTDNKVTISGPLDETNTIIVYDQIGNKVKEINVKEANDSLTINTIGLSVGIYLLQIRKNNNVGYNTKLIIIR